MGCAEKDRVGESNASLPSPEFSQVSENLQATSSVETSISKTDDTVKTPKTECIYRRLGDRLIRHLNELAGRGDAGRPLGEKIQAYCKVERVKGEHGPNPLGNGEIGPAQFLRKGPRGGGERKLNPALARFYESVDREREWEGPPFPISASDSSTNQKSTRIVDGVVDGM